MNPPVDVKPYFPLTTDVFGATTSPAHAIYGQIRSGLDAQPMLLAANPVVIAPLFQRRDYMPYTDLMWNAAYWGSHSGDSFGSSAGGDYSRFDLDDFPPPYRPNGLVPHSRVSSYTYLDVLLRKATIKYPSATKFSMVGHSAGRGR